MEILLIISEVQTSGVEVEDAVVEVVDYSIYFRSTTAFPVLFYNEFESEGQSTDELFLITSNEVNSHMHKIKIKEGMVEVILEDISRR